MIHEQVVAVSENLFKHHSNIDYDHVNYDWMTVERYQLPHGWEPGISPLMIIFPTEYPQLAPVGFYLAKHVRSPHGHLLNSAHHGASDAPMQQGWNWYCAYVNPGSWCPAYGRYADDWRKGDSLFDYFTLVGEVLASND